LQDRLHARSFFILPLLQVIGAAILFGTGLGIAFFQFMADRREDPDQTWIMPSLMLYVLVGACWLPVVVLQIRMRDLAAAAAAANAKTLPS
jgi:uncharacterized membrane protein